MFSKVLTFGLAALALVHAAPSFQMPMLSCNVNFETSVAPAHALDKLPNGTYNIYNAAWGSAQLRSYSTDQPIFVSLTLEWPGDFGRWKVQELDDSSLYNITNIGLNSPAHSSNDLVVAGSPAEGFSIEQAGDNVFTIRVPNEDDVWTTDTNTKRSDVHLEGQVGTTAQLWRFVPVDYAILVIYVEYILQIKGAPELLLKYDDIDPVWSHLIILYRFHLAPSPNFTVPDPLGTARLS
ncbi:hypothetical protein DFH07DRAFT_1054608 [Mycena maculata]|uniref:Uncharacterized protein n=1 Tax=Mycena maculata TaxID=230809 RepID=A0AAD7KGT0_9AGAR|nr:hypothetical protein DFH07DRAFT_1054608 [Mycena maculata]